MPMRLPDTAPIDAAAKWGARLEKGTEQLAIAYPLGNLVPPGLLVTRGQSCEFLRRMVSHVNSGGRMAGHVNAGGRVAGHVNAGGRVC